MTSSMQGAEFGARRCAFWIDCDRSLHEWLTEGVGGVFERADGLTNADPASAHYLGIPVA